MNRIKSIRFTLAIFAALVSRHVYAADREIAIYNGNEKVVVGSFKYSRKENVEKTTYSEEVKYYQGDKLVASCLESLKKDSTGNIIDSWGEIRFAGDGLRKNKRYITLSFGHRPDSLEKGNGHKYIRLSYGDDRFYTSQSKEKYIVKYSIREKDQNEKDKFVFEGTDFSRPTAELVEISKTFRDLSRRMSRDVPGLKFDLDWWQKYHDVEIKKRVKVTDQKDNKKTVNSQKQRT
jgi:hypothetical protein